MYRHGEHFSGTAFSFYNTDITVDSDVLERKQLVFRCMFGKGCIFGIKIIG